MSPSYSKTLPSSSLLPPLSMRRRRLLLGDLLCCQTPFSVPCLFPPSADQISSFTSHEFLHSTPSPNFAIFEDLPLSQYVSHRSNYLKRRAAADAEGSCGKLKQQKSENSLLRVPAHPWVIVGKLQLWKQGSFQKPALSFASHCIALSDHTATLPCVIRNMDPQLLGQTVLVTAFNFIPQLPLSTKKCEQKSNHEKDSSKSYHRTDFLANLNMLAVDNHLSAADCHRGLLEIHQLQVLQSRDQTTNIHSTFDSLCLMPDYTDLRTVVNNKPDIVIWGSLYSMSPLFNVPWMHQQPATGGERATSRCKEAERREISESIETEAKYKSNSMLGFLLELHSCSHIPPCELKNKAELQSGGENQSVHKDSTAQQKLSTEFSSNSKSGKHQVAQIYFSGCLAAWRPALSGALGLCISVTGLQRNRIAIGSEKIQCLIFVATERSLVTLLGPDSSYRAQNQSHFHQCSNPDHSPKTIQEPEPLDYWPKQVIETLPIRILDNDKSFYNWKGNAVKHDCCSKQTRKDYMCSLQQKNKVIVRPRIGCYIGIVTAMHFQGKLIEMDDKVWLLLTHQQLTKLYGLRVGAMLSLWHVHFILLQAIWEKVLIFGACLLSHIEVVAYSPFQTQTGHCVEFHCHLSKLMQCIPFPFIFWVLKAAYTMKLKFNVKDGDLLGSKKLHLGIKNKRLEALLVPNATLLRDPLKEFLFHGKSCQLGKSSLGEPIWTPPISKICEHLISLWEKSSAFICGRYCKSQRKDDWFSRQVISSKELRFVLSGALQVCESSGKLQLVDCTGVLDVIVPDLSCVSNLQKVYEVADFHVVFESFFHKCTVCHMKSGTCKCMCPSRACISRKSTKGSSCSNKVVYYAVFVLKAARCLHDLQWPLGRKKETDRRALQLEALFQKPITGQSFNILLLTHKHPIRHKPMYDHLTFLAEAIILPFIVHFPAKSDKFQEEADQRFIELLSATEAFSHFAGDMGVDCSEPPMYVQSMEGCEDATALCTISKISSLEECVSHYVRSNVDNVMGVKSMYPDLPRSTLVTDFAENSQSPYVLKAVQKSCNMMMNLRPRRVVLEFNCLSTLYHKVVQIGHCYLRSSELGCRQEDDVLEMPCFHSVKMCHGSTANMRLSCSLGCGRIMLSLKYAEKTLVVDAHRPLWRVDFADAGVITSDMYQNRPPLKLPTSSQDLSLFGNSAYGRHCRNCKFMLFSSSDNNSGLCSECMQITNSLECYCGVLDTGTESGLKKPLSTVLSTSMCPSQLSELYIELPRSLRSCIFGQLKSIRTQYLSRVLSVKDLIEKYKLSVNHLKKDVRSYSSSDSKDEKSDSLGFIEPCQEGSLTSIFGQVTKLSLGLSSSLEKHKDSSSVSSAFSSSKDDLMVVEVQDISGEQKVIVFLDILHGEYHLGLGPGAVVSFHRILIQRNADGDMFLQSTVVTLCTVHSVQECPPAPGNSIDISKHVVVCKEPPEYDREKTMTKMDLDKLSSMNDGMFLLRDYAQELKLSCRVVAVKRLLLKSLKRSLHRSRLMHCGRRSCYSNDISSSSFEIHASCFILDDGYRIVECWAIGAVAAQLLGLDSSTRTLSSLHQLTTLERPSRKHFIANNLCMLVHKYNDVLLESDHPFGNSYIRIKGRSSKNLSNNEEDIINTLVTNACSQGPMVVLCGALQGNSTSDSSRNFFQKMNGQTVSLTNKGNKVEVLIQKNVFVAKHVERVSYIRESSSLIKELDDLL